MCQALRVNYKHSYCAPKEVINASDSLVQVSRILFSSAHVSLYLLYFVFWLHLVAVFTCIYTFSKLGRLAA